MEITKYLKESREFNKENKYFIKNNKIIYTKKKLLFELTVSEIFKIIEKPKKCNNCKLNSVCYRIKNTENEIFHTIDKCIKQGE